MPSTRPTSPNSSDGGSRSRGERRRRRCRASRRPGGRRRPSCAHQHRGRRRLGRSPRASDPCHARRCRGSRRRQGGPLRPRRPLRRHQCLHQEHPWLGRRRCRVLARPHARGRRGPSFHRSTHGDPRVRGHRYGRPTSAARRTAAAQAVEFVGLPEAQLNLAQAAIHLATSPKSNRVTQAIFEAKAAAREAGTGEVPPHLRDAHYSGRRRSVTAPTTGIPMTTRRVTLSSSIARRDGRSGVLRPHGSRREGRLRQWWPGHRDVGDPGDRDV